MVLIFLASFLFLGYALYCKYVAASSYLPQFPGPPSWPIVGNILSIYKNQVEIQYLKWAAIYGDVYKVKFGCMPAIVVNSVAAAQQIFAGGALSSRPTFYTFHNIISSNLGPTIGASEYGETMKRSRKETAAELSKPAVKANLDILDCETRQLLVDFMTQGNGGESPVEISTLVARMSLSVSLTICYGREMRLEDSLTKEVLDIEDQIARLRSPTGNLQDFVPLLRLWPFNGKCREAARIRDLRDAYVSKLNAEVEEKIQNKTYRKCLYTKNHFSDHPLRQEELSSVLVSFFAGGLATGSNTIRWCLTLLASRPDIQEKAYRAIRELYPNDASVLAAVMEDDESIPYISALVRECLRYYTPGRMSLPRCTVRESQYKGMTIPANIMVVLNAWACNMDSTVYGDPAIFRPERWIENPSLPLFTYGLGFRMCAGYQLANRELYVIMMRVVSFFKIHGPGNLNADPITGCNDPADMVMGPKRYEFRFEPRDQESLKNILFKGQA